MGKICDFYSFRHWQSLSDKLGIKVQPKATLTFSKCLEMGLQEHVVEIAKVAEVAGKEFSIEQVRITANMVKPMHVMKSQLG